MSVPELRKLRSRYAERYIRARAYKRNVEHYADVHSEQRTEEELAHKERDRKARMHTDKVFRKRQR